MADARARRSRASRSPLAASAPLVWLLSDLLITGDPLWSLTNTRHTAHDASAASRDAERSGVRPAARRRDPRPPVLAGAALGSVLGLLWLARRVPSAAAAALRRAVVFAAFAALGLPINTRYAFALAAILCVFAGAGVFGWRALAHGDTGAGAAGSAGGASCWSRCSPPRPSQYKARTANSTNSRASRTSRTTSWRSSTTAPSACAAAPSACPTTLLCRCSRCI